MTRRALFLALGVVAALAVAIPLLVRQPALAIDVNGTFTDDDGNRHEPYIEAIAAAGITTGCTATHYCPSDTVTRAQMASFLARAFTLARASDERSVGARYRVFPEGAPFPSAATGVPRRRH